MTYDAHRGGATWAGLGLVLGALTIAGCNNARAAEEIVIEDLPAASVNEAGVWESMPWSGTDWIRYPGRATVSVPHDLGREPSAVLVYLAFDASGQGAALGAGDLVRVVEMTSERVRIRNDTNGDYFLRLVLE